MSSAPQLTFEECLQVLQTHAGAADAEPVWPAASWDALRRSGVLSWIIPTEYGGSSRDPLELLEGYQRLAGACLTTSFLLSQRESACRRLRDSGNERLCRRLLPALASGQHFATVGLSQLTTSRQHVRPVLTARLDENDGVRLNGVMPWVTGAPHADHFLTGVVLEDGRQMLLVVPGDAPGLSVGRPLELMALQGSLTAEVRCDDVRLDREWILAGPAERVLAGGGAGGLETSGLALGLAKSAITYLENEANKRTEWRGRATSCAESWEALQSQLRRLLREGADAHAANHLRAKVNALVLRATQFALAAGKGSAFLRSHPAQRWARQAMFFLVWSCPAPALDATLTCLALPE